MVRLPLIRYFLFDLAAPVGRASVEVLKPSEVEGSGGGAKFTDVACTTGEAQFPDVTYV